MQGIVYSDSQYLTEGMRHLVQRWNGNGWRKRNGRPFAHRAFWEHLIDQSSDAIAAELKLSPQ